MLTWWKEFAAHLASLQRRRRLDRNRIRSDLSHFRSRQQSGESDVEYAKLLEGKRVAIVGPARTLFGERQGTFIDAHDVIVRFNDVIEHLPVPADLAPDIGTRTDVVYCTAGILGHNILSEAGLTHDRFAEVCRKSAIQYIVCGNNSLSFERNGHPAPRCKPEDRDVVARFTRLLDAHALSVRFRLVHDASETLIGWLQGQFPRTGMVAMLDLLSADIESLHVTGMTFYHGGGHIYAPETAGLHPLRNRDGSLARNTAGIGHDSYLELAVMAVIAEKFAGTLSVDEPLQRLIAGLRS